MNGLRGRGLEALAIDLPRGRAERAVPAYHSAAAGRRHLVLGGHSFGGRVASLAAAGMLASGQPVDGLLLLSYPLHRPGAPETWIARTVHWPLVTCPVLLLSGEADPFARLALLHEAVARLPDARLVTCPRVGHGLLPVLDQALDAVADFIQMRG